jgi:hypothetical protein
MLWLDPTLVNTMSNNDSSNNYYRIVYLLNDIRLIRCRDDLQWITTISQRAATGEVAPTTQKSTPLAGTNQPLIWQMFVKL